MAHTPLFQLGTSIKPTYADLGGGLVENDPIYPPAPTMINADHQNEMGGAIEGICETMCLARVRVTHTAGTYSKVSGKACNKQFQLGASLITGNVVITKNGVGDLTFQFTTGIIPTIEDAWVSFHHTSLILATATIEMVDGRTVRVRIGDCATLAARDALFTLYVC